MSILDKEKEKKDQTNLFFIIDQFIFKNIDLLKNEVSFQKLDDFINDLEEKPQKILILSLAFIFLLGPFFFAAYLTFSNFKIRNNIEIKTQILDEIAVLNKNRDHLQNVTQGHIQTNGFADQSAFNANIMQILSVGKIESNKVSVIDFNINHQSSTIIKSSARLRLSNFGMSDFTSFMLGLVVQEKVKIKAARFTKDKNSNLLNGEIEVAHYGRNSAVNF